MSKWVYPFFAVAVTFAAMTQTAYAASPKLQNVSCSGAKLPVDAECLQLQVPEDRSKLRGRQIALHIVRLPAKHPGRHAILVFQGGPGQAASTLSDFYAGVYTGARDDFDIVLADQRGTGQSNGLFCDTVPAAARDPLGDLFGPDMVRQCRDTLSRRADLRQYTTDAAVEDADTIRAALGYPAIDIYGTSYGTRVTLQYARRHPQHVRTLTLKGVTAPQSVAPAAFAHDVERSVKLMLRDCVAQPQCVTAFPDLSGDLGRVEHSLDLERATAVLADGTMLRLSRGLFGATVRSMLQSTGLRAEVPLLIHRAATSDWQPLIARIAAIRKATRGELALGLMMSVFCTEDFSYLDVARARKDANGTVLGNYWVDQIAGACAIWPRGQVPRDWRQPFRVSAPSLVISGLLDPATPPSDTKATLEYLADAKEVDILGGSHSFSGMHGCIDKIMTAFVLSGSTKALDTRCAAAIRAPAFKTSMAAAR